jgi:hypothetical protein
MNSAREFLSGIVDYAGLFPPAGLDMKSAVSAYAEYHAGKDRDLLGRFVVPWKRLEEFAAELDGLAVTTDDPWKLSVIGSDAYEEVRRAIDGFNDSTDNASCDTVEAPVSSKEDVARAVTSFPEPFVLYLEVATTSDPHEIITEISKTPASAKLRTGGIVETAIPTPEQVYRFICECVNEGVPFKATAGLHHLIRGTYPLTYDVDSPTATMFGFLNVFLASAFCASGSSESAVLSVLEETHPSAFRFDDTGVWWRDHFVLYEQLAVVRQTVATSFGSCSFTEPVTEARNFQII